MYVLIPFICKEEIGHWQVTRRLIPKADRKKIHEYLFRGMWTFTLITLQIPCWLLFAAEEGVLVAKKDFNLPKHGDIDTKNLYVRLNLLGFLYHHASVCF